MLETDSHSHLSLVEARLGGGAIAAFLSAYSSAWEASSGNAGVAPFMVDVGIRPGDLASRVERFGAYLFVRFSAGLWPGRESLEKPDEALKALKKDIGSARCCPWGMRARLFQWKLAERADRAVREQVALAFRQGLASYRSFARSFRGYFGRYSSAATLVPVSFLASVRGGASGDFP